MILRNSIKTLAAAALALGSLCAGNSCRAESWPLWSAYTAAFLDPSGRIVDHQSNDRTTSEGQSYALFFSLVANDRADFDKILDWTQNNLAQGDLTEHLPGWEWGKSPQGDWKLLDANTASDADLWISYTLLQAGRLWKEPRYSALGKLVAQRIQIEEVAVLPNFGPMLLPAKEGFHPDATTWVLNPSYLPLPLLASLHQSDPDGPWGQMADKLPALLKAASPNGFSMDWVSYAPGQGFHPALPPAAPKDAKPQGSYDAIRVYLWAGMTPTATPAASAALHAVPGMASYLGTHLLPPAKEDASGQVIDPDGPVGFSAAVMPYLSMLGAKNSLEIQQSRLDAQVNPANKLYGKPSAYYDQNLALFGEGWIGHYFGFGRSGDLWVKWNSR